MKDITYTALRKVAAEIYGQRPDGTNKGSGWQGAHDIGDSVVTEYSVGVDINGQERDIPTITPYTNRFELAAILSAARLGICPPRNLIDRAADWARYRMSIGKSPFYENTPEDRGLREFLSRMRWL